jgi:phosphate acetyltransferase
MDLIEKFKEKAKRNPRKIVFPEGNDEKILTASLKIAKEGIAYPIVLGSQEEIEETASRLNLKLEGITIYDPSSSQNLKKYSSAYSKKRKGISEKIAVRLVKKNLMFGAMMVSQGDAEGMVAGVAHATGSVIQAAALAVGYEDGISNPSSFFIMVLPEYSGEKDKILIFADGGVSINPAPQELAEIAVTAGRNARALLNIEPRIALLSFSTQGSAAHPLVEKVVVATKIAQKMAPELLIDGELQADAALVKKVAERKVAGKANVLIFPNLEAANIAYKLTQYLAKAKAYGPILQGFSKPVNDMSRGASIEDIVGVAAITVVQTQGIVK